MDARSTSTQHWGWGSGDHQTGGGQRIPQPGSAAGQVGRLAPGCPRSELSDKRQPAFAGPACPRTKW